MKKNKYNSNTTDPEQELLVEVSEKNKPISFVTRLECHNQTRKPWHRSTHVYLFNNKGQLYLTQRSMNKDVGPYLWTISAGGHVIFGSTPKETAEREVLEELGIKVNLDLIDKQNIDSGSEKEIISIFSCVTDKKPNINKEEVKQIKAFDFDKIVKKFSNGKFSLSVGSQDSFEHLIKSGKLKKYRDKLLKLN